MAEPLVRPDSSFRGDASKLCHVRHDQWTVPREPNEVDLAEPSAEAMDRRSGAEGRRVSGAPEARGNGGQTCPFEAPPKTQGLTEPACPMAKPGDLVMRRMLRVSASGTLADKERAERTFSISILLSATRCLLSYVVLPVLTVILGVASSVLPFVGIPVAAAAIIADVIGMRRFWLVNHRLRWHVTVVYVAIIAFVGYLLIQDIRHVIGY